LRDQVGHVEFRQVRAAKPAQMAGAIALLLVCLALLSTALYRNAANRDFICYWSSAKLLRAHENPYAGQAVLEIENAAGGGYREPFIMRNPPWALFLVAPLGHCSAPVAAFFWLLALIGLALLSVKCLRMGCKPPPLIVYLFAPVLGCAMAGQTSIFLLAGIAFFFKYHEERPVLSGLALLMPAMKPHLFLLLWPVILMECVRKKNWRLLAGFGAGLAVAAVVPMFFDAQIWAHYLAAIRAEHIEGQYLANLSFLLRFMVPGHPVWVQAVPSVLGIAFCARYYWRRRGVWDWRVDGAALLLISAMVSPYSWPFDQLLLLPTIIHVASVRQGRRTVAWLAVVNGAALVFLLLTVPLSSPVYAWSGTACLIWYVWARRKARLGGVRQPAAELATV
jgi:Glycosyltransferase family 87